MVGKSITKCDYNTKSVFGNKDVATNMQGVTLVELLVVIAIIGIMTAVGMTSINPHASKVKTAAMNIKTDLMFAKSEAIKRNESIIVEFDAANNAYNATIESGNVIYSRILDADVSIDVHFSSSKTSFRPLGTATSGYVNASGFGNDYKILVNSVGKVVIE